MNTKAAIDYRKLIINHLIECIEDNLKLLKEMNDMPDNLIQEKINKDRLNEALYYENLKKGV